MELVGRLCTVFYALVSILLIGIALALVGHAVWEIARSGFAGTGLLSGMLDAASLIIISMAIVDVGKYLLEEEVLRDRELRSAVEARQTLTKFMVIICIAVSLDALVSLSRVHSTERPADLVYPAVLLLAAVAVMVGLGVYQRLSTIAERREDETSIGIVEQEKK